MPLDHEDNNNTQDEAPTLHDELDAAYAEIDSQPDTPESAPEPVDALETSASTEPEGGAGDLPADDSIEPESTAAEAAAPDAESAAKPDDDVEALIKESGIRSVRGQERIRKIFTEKKELAAKAQEYESDISQFKDMVQQTRMSPEQFGEVLEIGRLANSDSPEEKRLALERLDAHRAMLAKELGIEVPGVDPLEDFPELKQAVDSFEITKEHALQLAKYQRIERSQQAQRQAQVMQQQEVQQYQASFQQAATTATAIFKSFEHETDYPAKMKMIEQFVKQPGKMEEIVRTYQPQQLPAYFRDLYANLRVVPSPQSAAQPIRSRPMHAGAPSTQGQSLRDSLAAATDHLGI